MATKSLVTAVVSLNTIRRPELNNATYILERLDCLQGCIDVPPLRGRFVEVGWRSVYTVSASAGWGTLPSRRRTRR